MMQRSSKARLPGALFAVLGTLLLLQSFGFAGDPSGPDRTGFVSRFGKRYLADADLVAEVTVDRIHRMGMGVDVVRVKLDRVLLDRHPEAGDDDGERLVLAYRDEFTVDTRLLLILRQYRDRGRLTAIHRLSSLDRLYKEKVRLMEDYIEIEGIVDKNERMKRFVAMVLKNLDDDSSWVRWNSLFELEGLVSDRRWRFTTGDGAYLAGLKEETKDDGFKRSLDAVREKMIEAAEEGPSTLEAEEMKNKKTGSGRP